MNSLQVGFFILNKQVHNADAAVLVSVVLIDLVNSNEKTTVLSPGLTQGDILWCLYYKRVAVSIIDLTTFTAAFDWEALMDSDAYRLTEVSRLW